MLERNHLKEYLFSPWFQKFQSMVSWLHGFEPEVRQNIMVARV
jgi:hypothetical protein